ncbi:MAG: cytochrome c3 family protein [Anaerolineales bacterium]
MSHRIRHWTILTLALAAIAVTLALTTHRADATPLPQAGVSNESCLKCHADSGLTFQLENGETASLYIDQAVYDNSIHGKLGYACVQCHTDLEGYPHPSFSATDQRDLALELYDACFRCHSGQYERTLDSVHENALESGNRQAAICTDCHGAHNIQQLTDPRTDELLPEARLHIPVTCAKCHNAIYRKYLTSVHGNALVNENNRDVPTCIDCHGVHNIEDPTTARFRLLSPEICAKCHTDPKIMDKYGISTQVLNTYVADFHGTTVTIFEKVSPDAPTNKAVCYDCHGVHDIQSVSDPESGLEFKQNLLKRCQVCHPDATTNFSGAWLSHYIPSPQHNPLVYYVNLFYSIFIPGLLGGMGVLVVLDVTWYIRKRRAAAKAESEPEEPPAPSEGDQRFSTDGEGESDKTQALDESDDAGGDL